MSTLLKMIKISVKLGTRQILSDISFHLQSGQILTLIGPNGAGKTTLIRVLLGIIKPSSGNIIISPLLRIGYVPQKIYREITLPLTVKRFMQLKLGAEPTEIIPALKYVQADKLINYPIQTLSGGEIQRVLLARALLNKPQLLVLDEPTRGVDINGQIALYDLINKFRWDFNCGIMMVSHDLNLVMAQTDEVLCLNQHICCSGTPHDVSIHPEFRAMFGNKAAEKLALYHHHHNHSHNF
ncbi:MAG: zinc ABC transporter ATP-binding protein ZnuC [Candidatus Dasytiphilus stammeri]